MTGPLSAVLAAFEAGATSLPEVQERTGLSADLVRAGVDHLVRIGRLQAQELAQGCPSGGCGTCASATLAGEPGCGAGAPGPRRTGPVPVALTLPPRPADLAPSARPARLPHTPHPSRG